MRRVSVIPGLICLACSNVTAAGRPGAQPSVAQEGGRLLPPSSSQPREGGPGSLGPSGTSVPTTGSGAYANEVIQPALLAAQGPFGSGQDMLDLVGPHRTVTLHGPAGDQGLVLDIDVEYFNVRPERGESWVILQATDLRDGKIDGPSYRVVPVRITIRSQDGRIAEVWDNGELVSGERGRVSLEEGQEGPLSGSLGYDGVPQIDPPCNALWAMFDFRPSETLARLDIENQWRAWCIDWNTAPRPVPWRVIVNPRDP